MKSKGSKHLIVVIIRTNYFDIISFVFFNTVYSNVWCVSHKKATMLLNSINQFVFVIEGHYVFCKVGTELLNVFQINFNILRDATDSLKNNICNMAINIEIIVKRFSSMKLI
jgi:hypothetical protein